MTETWDFGAELPLTPENMWADSPNPTPETPGADSDDATEEEPRVDFYYRFWIPVVIPRPLGSQRNMSWAWSGAITHENRQGLEVATFAQSTFLDGREIYQHSEPLSFVCDSASLPPSLPLAEELDSRTIPTGPSIARPELHRF